MNKKIITTFVALTDKVNEGKWVWDSDGSEAQYTFWDVDQPNGGSVEDCAMMCNASLGKWHDVRCNSIIPYFAICQKT